MDDQRQKNQLVLAFMEEDGGEAPKGPPEGTESSAGKRGTESPAIAEQLMEEVCGRENCKQALRRVKANKGSAGVDGMTVQQLPEYLKQYWPAIREQLLKGTYVPQPVKRVEIPKPDGGVRATDRAFHRDLDGLRLLKAERPPFETPPPLVLVSSQPEPPPSETAAPEPDPPAPSPEPSADPAPATPPDPQPPLEVLVGLRRIVSALSENLTPAQVATLTLPQAAALRESPGPDPQPTRALASPIPNPHPPLLRPPAPSLSTSQPIETTPQTEQMVSFRQKPEIAPPQAGGVSPLKAPKRHFRATTRAAVRRLPYGCQTVSRDPHYPPKSGRMLPRFLPFSNRECETGQRHDLRSSIPLKWVIQMFSGA